MNLPFDRTWWILQQRVLGGRFPGGLTSEENETALQALVDLGVTCVINLIEPDETGHGSTPFPDYRSDLSRRAKRSRQKIRVLRVPIRDNDIPEPAQVRMILDEIADEPLTYIHCWGGHGRTGTIGGCLLREMGYTADEALDIMEQARIHDPHLRRNDAPQTPAQRQFIAAWQVPVKEIHHGR